MMWARAVLIWVVLLFVAIANGAIREAILIPRVGSTAGQAVSVLMLSSFIFILGWFSIRWIGAASVQQAWAVGTAWLALTLAFEFLGGHYLFGKSWSVLLANYNVFAGRMWVLVLLVTTVTPVLAFVQREVGRANQ